MDDEFKKARDLAFPDEEAYRFTRQGADWAYEWCQSDIEGMKIAVQQYNHTNQEYRKELEALQKEADLLYEELEYAMGGFKQIDSSTKINCSADIIYLQKGIARYKKFKEQK